MNEGERDTGYKTFLVDYKFRDEWWTIEIPARDISEIHFRLLALTQPGVKVAGTLEQKLPQHMGWWAKLKVWLLNRYQAHKGGGQ